MLQQGTTYYHYVHVYILFCVISYLQAYIISLRTGLIFSGSVKGPDPLGDDPNLMPARFFKEDMTPAQRKEIVMKAYERLKVSLDKFLKPDGTKEAPAKTCGDIKYHHPNFESGK